MSISRSTYRCDWTDMTGTCIYTCSGNKLQFAASAAVDR